MEYVKEFLKPELMVLIPVIYFIGIGLKKSQQIKDAYIPMILGTTGILLATLYVFANCEVSSYQGALMALFTAITQGVLVAGCSVFVNQIVKQSKNFKE